MHNIVQCGHIAIERLRQSLLLGCCVALQCSHKREVELVFDGAPLTHYGNVRYSDLSPTAQSLFTEVTCKAVSSSRPHLNLCN